MPWTPVTPAALPAPTGAMVSALAAIFAAGLAVATTAAMAASVLSSLGISAAVAIAVVKMVLGAAPSSGAGGAASQAVLAGEAAYRAAYVAHACVRVQNAVNAGTPLLDALRRELRYLKLHLRAQLNRRKAAAQADRVARWVDMQTAYGPACPPGATGMVLLAGWKAVVDARTSPECRAANGCNYRVTQPPLIGYPGTVHVACRCTSVAPYPGAPVLDALTPAMPHR